VGKKAKKSKPKARRPVVRGPQLDIGEEWRPSAGAAMRKPGTYKSKARRPFEQLGAAMVPRMVPRNPLLSLRMKPDQMQRIEAIAASEGMTRETWARAQLLKASRAVANG